MTPQTELGLQVLRALVRQRDLITDSLRHIRIAQPLTPEALKALSRHDRAELDALVHRMARLQDYLGKQGFRTILIVDLAEVPASMTDVLGQMEKIGVVDGTDDWARLRAARNALTHEYGTDDERTARALQGLLDGVPAVTEIADRTIRHLAGQLRPKAPEALIESMRGS